MNDPAFVITGPTAGIGYRTALEVAGHGDVVLVGRDPAKLAAVRETIEQRGGTALPVVCDLAEPASVHQAAEEILALDLPIAGLLNNAGVSPTRPSTNRVGWDTTFATNHLGPFALTEALAPHLPDGANVVFICSAVEDPARRFATMAGFRGGRYISAEASVGVAAEITAGAEARLDGVEPQARGLAASKQCNLATVLAFATVLTDSTGTGVYFDENGRTMRGSALVHDADFQDRVVAETRALLATVIT